MHVKTPKQSCSKGIHSTTHPVLSPSNEDATYQVQDSKPAREDDVILFLSIGSFKNFPVHWAHYACWHSIVNRNLEKLQQEALSGAIGEKQEFDVISTDFMWAKLSLHLIEQVKRRSNDLDDNQHKQLTTARDASHTLHAKIATAILGSPSDYCARVYNAYTNFSWELVLVGAIIVVAVLALTIGCYMGDRNCRILAGVKYDRRHW